MIEKRIVPELFPVVWSAFIARWHMRFPRFIPLLSDDDP